MGVIDSECKNVCILETGKEGTPAPTPNLVLLPLAMPPFTASDSLCVPLTHP